MKKFLTFLALAGAMTAGAQAQVQIDSETFNYIDDFIGFDGTADPANWTTTDAAGATASTWQGTGNGSGTAGGKYSFGDTGSGATFEGSLGFLPSSSRAINATISFEVGAGLSLTGFDVAYDAELWRSTLGGRTNGWAVSWSLNGGAGTLLNDLTYLAPNTNANGVNPSGGPWETLTLSTSVSQALGAGDIVTLTFFGDNGTGGGSRQGVAIDNFEFTAVPEPSTYALLGLAGAGIAAYRLRRRARR
jgi:hypothetical protein